MKSSWVIHKKNDEHQIVYLIDRNDGQTSITNDAENVLRFFQQLYGPKYRVVYKDTDGEWWEMFWAPGWGAGQWRIAFKEWHGLDWDILTRKAEQ